MAKRKQKSQVDSDPEFEEIERRFAAFEIEDPGVEKALTELRRALDVLMTGVDEIVAGQHELKQLCLAREPVPASESKQKKPERRGRRSE